MRHRSRLTLAPLAGLTILLGLGSRRYAAELPAVVARYAGDVLWATLVYWCLALVRPRTRALHLAIATLGVAFTVEVSQLYHAPWLDDVRASRVGALVLGQGFLWSDLACYAAGVLLAIAVDRLLHARKDTGPRPSPG